LPKKVFHINCFLKKHTPKSYKVKSKICIIYHSICTEGNRNIKIRMQNILKRGGMPMHADEKGLKEKRLFLGLVLLWIIAMGIEMIGMKTTNSQLIAQNDALMQMNQELKAQNERITGVLEKLDHKVSKITDRIDKDDRGVMEQDFFGKANKRRSTIKKEPI
jgi:hypothetical protein